MKILDCTLRDGGYYNNWDFSPLVVDAYLKAMADAKIDYVELGLRNFTKQGFDGPFAYTTESFLNRLNLPLGPCYGVMVDAKTILSYEDGVQSAIESLFVDAKESKIELIRIAAHFHEVENCGDIVNILKAKGYKVGFNLMQAGGKESKTLVEKSQIASGWGCLDVLYFADSLGNMDNSEVMRICNALKKGWKGKIGIHTHNNMGKGVSNTLTALDNGVTWLDATITGMGRGAGNAQTENLIASLESSKYNALPIYDLVIRHFETMQKKSGWGSNLLYFLGAKNNVHPTYIQNLLSDSHYGTEEVIGAIEYLSKIEGTSSYDGDVFNSALNSRPSAKITSGNTDLVELAKGKNILIVAEGPGLIRYLDEIKSYIQERKPIVIAINAINSLPKSYVDYYCILHNSKFLSQKTLYRRLEKPFILPKHRFSEGEIKELENIKILDYGVEVDGDLIPNPSFAKLPYDLTAAYALCIAEVSKPNCIYLVGFDGFEKGDKRQEEMVDVFNRFRAINSKIDVVSLTPTTYPVLQSSIYAPHI